MATSPGGIPPPSVQPAGTGPRAYLPLLRNGSFRNLTLSTLLATLGDWVGFLAILALTESILGQTRAAAFAVSVVMAARVLPSMLLGPIAGVFVDRWDRRRLMIFCHLGRAVVMALIPFSNDILALLLATLLIEVLASLFGPAKDSVLPSLVRPDRLVLANQVNLVVTYGTLPLGGVLFAALLALAGPLSDTVPFLAERPVALPIWMNSLAFLLSAALLTRLRVPAPAEPGEPVGRVDRAGPVEPAGPAGAVSTSSVPAAPVGAERHPPGAWQQLREGFTFIGGHPVIRALILGVMLAFGSAGVVISTGQFFANVVNAGSQGFGILVGIVGTGLLVGLVAAAPLSSRVRPERLFAPGIAIAGAGLVATALMPTLTAAAPTALLMGAGAGVAFIVGYTILQSRADEQLRGRTFGAFNSGVRVAIFGSTTAAPFLVGVIGREQRELIYQEGVPALLYPYAIGGVRLTLVIGGLLSLIGAALTGRALNRALAREAALALPPDAAEPAHRGLLIVFEGGDGAGKTTQIRLLRASIARFGLTVHVTREPGGTPIGEAVREVLLAPDSAAMSDRAEALLYAAARAQHVAEVIAPALARGEVVISDRYIDSSIVYQGAGRGLGEDVVATLNRWATAGLRPDLVVLLDVDPGEGLRRVGGQPDRLEAAGEAFHRTVAEAYRRRAAEDPERTLVLDATLPVEQLHGQIRRAVVSRMARAGLVVPAPPVTTPAPEQPHPEQPGPTADVDPDDHLGDGLDDHLDDRRDGSVDDHLGGVDDHLDVFDVSRADPAEVDDLELLFDDVADLEPDRDRP